MTDSFNLLSSIFFLSDCRESIHQLADFPFVTLLQLRWCQRAASLCWSVTRESESTLNSWCASENFDVALCKLSPPWMIDTIQEVSGNRKLVLLFPSDQFRFGGVT